VESLFRLAVRCSEPTVALETAEIEAFTDLYRSASAEAAAASRLSVTELGGLILLAVN
jgi:hypothetical protein